MTSLSPTPSFFTTTTSFATGTVAPTGSFFTTVTGVAAASSSPIYDSSTDDATALSDLLATYTSLISSLRIALGALVFGLVFASLTYGAVITRASSYFRSRTGDSWVLKGTVGSLVLVNTVQLIATIHAAYTAIVPDFGDFYGLIGKNEWRIQIGLVTLAASVAQAFFALRLYAVKRNRILSMASLHFTTIQFVLSWVAVGILFNQGYINVFLRETEDEWALVTTLGIAAGINTILAVVSYIWVQRPCVLQRYGRATFADELEYWTIKSLFGCAILSMLAAILASVMSTSMVWLAISFSLGNLYTISVLLSLKSRPLATPAPSRWAMPTMAPVLPPASPPRSSVATLTNSDSDELWRDISKAHLSKAAAEILPQDTGIEGPPPPHYYLDEKALGYHTHDNAV